MISKNRKRKILIPKGVKLRHCSVQLGQINNLLSRMNSMKRKMYSKPLRIGAAPPPGTKLIRVKSDLFKKAPTPTPSTNSERVSKRTPKPNRRYVNEETVFTSTWKEASSEEQSENEEVNRRQKSPQTEPTRKNRISVTAPKTVAGTSKKGGTEKVALTKRKIEYDYDEKQNKKVSKTKLNLN